MGTRSRRASCHGRRVFGDPAIVFEVDVDGLGLDMGDRSLSITVDGIRLGGATVGHTWQTTSFVPSVPHGTIDPDYAGFGQVTLGTSSVRALSVRNDGSSDMHLGVLYLDDWEHDQEYDQFQVVDDQCSLQTLAPGTGCSAHVAFTPTSMGLKTAALFVPTDGWLMPYGADLAGLGIDEAPEPTNVVATGISPSEVRLTWDDVMGGDRLSGEALDGRGCRERLRTSGSERDLVHRHGAESGLRVRLHRVCLQCERRELLADSGGGDIAGRPSLGSAPTPAPPPATTKVVDDKSMAYNKAQPG